ncbi:MAG: hypothetical protein COA45_09660 [Zetaproteobacteria bacterium]|nr:MAG: hypothetical protein COA45_09660 [Zetaproteobacteria bacterium]
MDVVISPELPQALRLIIALCIVFLIMGGLALALKKLGLTTDSTIKSGDKRRLKIVESIPLDARRRLTIVKCDDKEHLVILGANSEIVIDTDIPSVDGS